MAKFFLHLTMIEFFFFSGEVYYTSTVLGGGGKLRLVFPLTCLMYVFTSPQKFLPSRINIHKLSFIFVWVLLCTYLFGQGSHDLTWLSYIVFAIGMFLIMSIVDFDHFRNLLLRYLVWLSIVSIIVQIGHDYLGIFPATAYVDATGHPRFLSLGLFTTEWGENRLASFFWEPGQYQVVIYYILVLFADEWSDIKTLRKNLFKFGILVIALIMTISTTAYIILGILVLIIIQKNGQRYIKYIPVLLLFGSIAAYFLYNSDAIQKKVEQSEEGNAESSYMIRVADNIGCLMVTLEDPLTGFGPGSAEMAKLLLAEGSETSSNGWLYGSAQLGIPYIIFLWICVWRNLRQMTPQVNRLLLFLILVISQANEATIFFPYMYMYVFSFKRGYISSNSKKQKRLSTQPVNVQII